MDSKGFRHRTFPDFKPITRGDFEKVTQNKDVMTYPIPDIRYPKYASIMQDGRATTDYRPHCAANVVSSDQGNSLRSWLQHNTNGIIEVSRKRQGDILGAQYQKADTVPQPRNVQICSPFECKMSRNPNRRAIGLQRSEPVPELFGTFNDTERQIRPPVELEYLTKTFEGGRNTPRGREFQPLGLQPVMKA